MKKISYSLSFLFLFYSVSSSFAVPLPGGCETSKAKCAGVADPIVDMPTGTPAPGTLPPPLPSYANRAECIRIIQQASSSYPGFPAEDYCRHLFPN